MCESSCEESEYIDLLNSSNIQFGRKIHRERNISTWKWGGNDHDDIEYIPTVEEKK
jgi:hypothetical protein